MSNYNTDGTSDNEWDDRGDVVWNEFDWEHYLRDQDEVLFRYIAFYERLKKHPQRLDETARMMGWDVEDWSSDVDEGSGTSEAKEINRQEVAADGVAAVDSEAGRAEGEAAEPDLIPEMSDDVGPYTLHKNPVFIATRAIYLSLTRSWERLASDPAKAPQAFAIHYMAALQRGETQSLLAIQSLDFGDYALAISLLKRALQELNATMALLGKLDDNATRLLRLYRDGAMPRLFDLREIWLRVMRECRQELACPSDEEFDDEDDEDF